MNVVDFTSGVRAIVTKATASGARPIVKPAKRPEKTMLPSGRSSSSSVSWQTRS